MVNINLVPEKLRSAEALKLIVVLGCLSLTLPAAFWALRFQAKRAELAAVEHELDLLNAELVSPQLKQVVADVEQFAKDQSDLDSKRSNVDKLRGRQMMILKLLDMLPDIVPRKARIKTMVVSDEKGAKKVDLSFEFAAIESVAAVYENLEASPLVDKLELVSGPEAAKDGLGKSVVSAAFKFSLLEQP